MAKKQVKKIQVQAEHIIFALDIGTRSIIGMVGTVENDKVKIIAVEKEDHTERAMIDGQIENIEKVSALAEKIKKRLEEKIQCKLTRVCVAAAGRALQTKRADFELNLPGTQLIDDEIISRLEAGAITKAEDAFDADNEAANDTRRFYLVGYTVCQYFLDQYMISSLKDHRGKHVKVDLIATFLPSEVIESLYTTMNKIGLEVASITLEPIAAINAAIPENLRLLNLVMVDIGAGTSDIAACTDGSVTGYTMATVAGDEITETIMKEYLVDFGTAEKMKAQIGQSKEIAFTDILGFQRTAAQEELLHCIQGTSDILCKEIAGKILDVNGGPPSALFLAGGGSKLSGLKEGLTVALQMDASRVAIAGNNFQANAFSEEYDLNNPEYATPLGIVISSGLNLINDSFRVILNNKPAKLFRSGSFTVLNLLMMNGYNFQDILGRHGMNITVTVNGKRKVFYGTSSQPASLLINKKEGKLSDVVRAGDSIDFIPAVAGGDATACLGDIDGADTCLEITLNGKYMPLETPLKNGDTIIIIQPEVQKPDEKGIPAEKTEGQENIVVKSVAEDAAEHVTTMFENDSVSEANVTVGEQWTGPVRQDEASPVTDYLTSDMPVHFAATAVVPVPTVSVSEQEDGAAAAAHVGTFQTTAIGPAADVSTGVTPAVPSETVSDAQTPGESGPVPASRAMPSSKPLLFYLNDSPIRLPRKKDGMPYYLMDMIEYSGIDLKNPRGKVNLSVNGMPGMFQQELKEGDLIKIEEEL